MTHTGGELPRGRKHERRTDSQALLTRGSGDTFLRKRDRPRSAIDLCPLYRLWIFSLVVKRPRPRPGKQPSSPPPALVEC